MFKVGNYILGIFFVTCFFWACGTEATSDEAAPEISSEQGVQVSVFDTLRIKFSEEVQPIAISQINVPVGAKLVATSDGKSDILIAGDSTLEGFGFTVFPPNQDFEVVIDSVKDKSGNSSTLTYSFSTDLYLDNEANDYVETADTVITHFSAILDSGVTISGLIDGKAVVQKKYDFIDQYKITFSDRDTVFISLEGGGGLLGMEFMGPRYTSGNFYQIDTAKIENGVLGFGAAGVTLELNRHFGATTDLSQKEQDYWISIYLEDKNQALVVPYRLTVKKKSFNPNM